MSVQAALAGSVTRSSCHAKRQFFAQPSCLCRSSSSELHPRTYHWCVSIEIRKVGSVSLDQTRSRSFPRRTDDACASAGLIFWDITKDGADEGAGRNLLGCLFFLASQIVFSPMDTLSLFCDDRELFNRRVFQNSFAFLDASLHFAKLCQAGFLDLLQRHRKRKLLAFFFLRRKDAGALPFSTRTTHSHVNPRLLDGWCVSLSCWLKQLAVLSLAVSLVARP